MFEVLRLPAQSICVVGSGAPNVGIYALDENGYLTGISCGGIGWGSYIHEARLNGVQAVQPGQELAYLLNPKTNGVAKENASYVFWYLNYDGFRF